jgi:hypothetical protein
MLVSRCQPYSTTQLDAPPNTPPTFDAFDQRATTEKATVREKGRGGKQESKGLPRAIPCPPHPLSVPTASPLPLNSSPIYTHTTNTTNITTTLQTSCVPKSNSDLNIHAHPSPPSKSAFQPLATIANLIELEESGRAELHPVPPLPMKAGNKAEISLQNYPYHYEIFGGASSSAAHPHPTPTPPPPHPSAGAPARGLWAGCGEGPGKEGRTAACRPGRAGPGPGRAGIAAGRREAPPCCRGGGRPPSPHPTRPSRSLAPQPCARPSAGRDKPQPRPQPCALPSSIRAAQHAEGSPSAAHPPGQAVAAAAVAAGQQAGPTCCMLHDSKQLHGGEACSMLMQAC